METLRGVIYRFIYVHGTISICEIQALLDKRFSVVPRHVVSAIVDGLLEEECIIKNHNETYSDKDYWNDYAII